MDFLALPNSPELSAPDETPIAQSSSWLLPLHDSSNRLCCFAPALAALDAIVGWAARAPHAKWRIAVSIATAGIFYVMTFGVLGVVTDSLCPLTVVASLRLVPALLARRSYPSGLPMRD